jgi:hypothetical protein
MDETFPGGMRGGNNDGLRLDLRLVVQNHVQQ